MAEGEGEGNRENGGKERQADRKRNTHKPTTKMEGRERKGNKERTKIGLKSVGNMQGIFPRDGECSRYQITPRPKYWLSLPLSVGFTDGSSRHTIGCVSCPCPRGLDGGGNMFILRLLRW